MREAAATTESFYVCERWLGGMLTNHEVVIRRLDRLSELEEIVQQDTESEYTDMEQVQSEIQAARRLYARRKWMTIDVTRRSIEETSAAILQMLATRREQRLQAIQSEQIVPE